jgi:O-acetyl-ADP-ribose deacetylase (regulator of RNase III)
VPTSPQAQPDVPARAAGASRLELVQGDITRQDTDGIVNAANSSLLGGGGVDGAIHRAGGPAILEECRRLRERLPQGLPPGEAVITGAGRMACRHVIHTVGPIWSGGGRGEADTLACCYQRSLALAAQHGLASLAFPSISTGAYGYPVEQAARVALRAVLGALRDASSVRLVRFVLFGASDLAVYKTALEALPE